METNTPVRFTTATRLIPTPSDVDDPELVAYPGDCGSYVGPSPGFSLGGVPLHWVAVRVAGRDYVAACEADAFEVLSPSELS